MGDSPKWVKSKKRRKRKRRGLNDGDNNGQATHGARKHVWRTQAAWAKSFLLVVCLSILCGPFYGQTKNTFLTDEMIN